MSPVSTSLCSLLPYHATIVAASCRLLLPHLLIFWLLCSQPAGAKPPHKAAVVNFYGEALPQNLRDCQLCHLTKQEIADSPAGAFGNEKQPWNAFGRSLYELGREQLASGVSQPAGILERMRSLADTDADGDGVANELELLAGTSPGHPQDVPNSQQLAAAETQLTELRRTLTYAWKPFDPVVRPVVPNVENDRWVSNPIDAFVAAQHLLIGLAPQPPAAPSVLLRRVYLDLIGLPPSREELAAFLADPSPDAYATVVDRLLRSPQYGERWGRHWMDIWRYSDWAGWGEQVRDSHPHIWRWRDWIIESLHDDKPYDQMVLEMLAADELYPGDQDALRATGYLVRNYKRLSREQWMADTVDHTGRAFLGVTYKCAQCHDHMYDPLVHEEYFQFRAIFESYKVRIDPVGEEWDTKQVGLSRAYDGEPKAQTVFYLRGDERSPDPERAIVPGVPAYLGGGPLSSEPIDLSYVDYYPSLRPAVLDARRRQLRDAIAAMESALSQAEAEEETAVSDSEFARDLAARRLEAAVADQLSLEARIAAEQAKHGVSEASDEAVKQLTMEASRLERQAELAGAEARWFEARQALKLAEQNSAEDDQRRKEVRDANKKLEDAAKAREAAAAAASADSDQYSALGEVYPKTSSGRRLALARWLIDRGNPLTSRVAANHIWARHFGRGLVATVDEFGRNGQPSALPALHDWLAAELMEPTQQYREGDTPQPWSMKHLHRLIVHSSTYRMGSGHDAIHAELDPENRYLWRITPRRIEAEAVRDSILHVAGSLDLQRGGQELDHAQALEIPRRSLYFRHAPEKQTQFLQIFDMAAPTECYQRRDSIIPQQALALANSELTVKQSRRLARRLHQQATAEDADFVSIAFRQVLSRDPSDQERSECQSFLADQSSVFDSLKEQGGTTTDESDLTKPAADAEVRARENLVHVLFNHHEFVMLR